MREVKLEDRLKEFRTDIDQLKLAQFAGQSNAVVKEFSTEDTWDIDEDITINAVTDVDWLIIARFTADHQLVPFVSFNYVVRIDDAPPDPLNNDFIVDIGVWNLDADYLSLDENNRSSSQVLGIFSTTPVTFNIKVKYTAKCVDTGVLSFETRT